jgi:hypothetical protein
MTTHLGAMVLFAVCVSVAFAALLRDDPREQLRIGTRVFGGFVAGAYLMGWFMFGLFG